MDLGKKDLFDANPEKELPAKRDSPGSTKGSNFMSNSLAAIRWQGLVKYSTDQEKPQAELSASRSLFMLPESATAGKPRFHLSTNRLRPAPSNHKGKFVFLG